MKALRSVRKKQTQAEEGDNKSSSQDGPEGLSLKKQTSKELQIIRQRKTKDKRKKKVKARDIRLAKVSPRVMVPLKV